MRCWATRRREASSKDLACLVFRMAIVKWVSAVTKGWGAYALHPTEYSDTSQFHHLDIIAAREVKNSTPKQHAQEDLIYKNYVQNWWERTSGHCDLDTYLNCLKLQNDKLTKTAFSFPLFSLCARQMATQINNVSGRLCQIWDLSSTLLRLPSSGLTILNSFIWSPVPSQRFTSIPPAKRKYYK